MNHTMQKPTLYHYYITCVLDIALLKKKAYLQQIRDNKKESITEQKTT